MSMQWSSQASPVQALTLQGLPASATANLQAFGLLLPGGTYLVCGNFDPTIVTGVPAPQGSLFLRTDSGATFGAGSMYIVNGSGVWVQA